MLNFFRAGQLLCEGNKSKLVWQEKKSPKQKLNNLLTTVQKYICFCNIFPSGGNFSLPTLL
jgi:hypothetical protein